MKKSTSILTLPVVGAENVPVVQPVYASSIFRMPNHRIAAKTEHQVHPVAYYTRWGNPTVSYLENQISLSCARASSLIFPSGMSAITTTLFSLVSAGDVVAVASSLYGDTTRFFLEDMRRFGVEVRQFDATEPASLTAIIAAGATAVYFESISNPDLRLADFAAIRSICSDTNVTTICDATFSPPGVFGDDTIYADLIIHSLTKYIGGHFSVFGGSVSGSQSLIEKIWHTQALYGASIDPQAAAQISQGIKTLEIRLARQSATALSLARYLGTHEKIDTLFYPLLDTRANAERPRAQLVQGGAVISFQVKGGEAAAIRLIEKTKVFGLSVSLGGVHSCIEHAESMSHSMLGAMDEALLTRHDVSSPASGLIRLSVGLENEVDLIEDMEQALHFA